MVLLIGLMQQHVVAARILANATLEDRCNKQHVVWPSVVGSGNDKESKWRDMSVKGVD